MVLNALQHVEWMLKKDQSSRSALDALLNEITDFAIAPGDKNFHLDNFVIDDDFVAKVCVIAEPFPKGNITRLIL